MPQRYPSFSLILSLVLGSLFFGFFGRSLLANLGLHSIYLLDDPWDTLVQYAFWILPPLISFLILYGREPSIFWKESGLGSGFLKGFVFAAAVVAPMAIGFAIFLNLDPEVTWMDPFDHAILPGFSEEFLFRAFVFGQLFFHTRWGFLPSVFLSSLIFGAGHLYQGSDVGETLSVFLITTAGGAWFCWLYAEWGRNLWLIAFIHILMNLTWTLFEAGDTATGSMVVNIFRFTTIAITVVTTIRKGKRDGFVIDGPVLWMKEKPSVERTGGVQ